MTHSADPGYRRSRWRMVGWGAAAALLLMPLLAMQVTAEVAWGPQDFALAALLVGGIGAAFELAVRRTASRAYRAGAAVALATGFLLVWANLGVGLVGSEEHPVNRLFFGVLVVAIAMAGIARLRPAGMARAMVATAAAQTLAFAYALLAGFAPPLAVLGFAALWLAAAWLFHRATGFAG